MATTLRMMHYLERAYDTKTVCGRDSEYLDTVTADRLIAHPKGKRMMRASERRTAALKVVTCKRCRKLKGAA